MIQAAMIMLSAATAVVQDDGEAAWRHAEANYRMCVHGAVYTEVRTWPRDFPEDWRAAVARIQQLANGSLDRFMGMCADRREAAREANRSRRVMQQNGADYEEFSWDGYMRRLREQTHQAIVSQLSTAG